MDHTKVSSLQAHRQRCQESIDGGTISLLNSLKRRVFLLVARLSLIEVPPGSIFGFLAKQVDLVIAKHSHRPSLLNQTSHQRKHSGAVVPAIAKITDEDQAPPLGVPPVQSVAQMAEQVTKRCVLAVDITDDVQRTLRQGLNQAHERLPSLFKNDAILSLHLAPTANQRPSQARMRALS